MPEDQIWYEVEQEEDESPFREYDITASPNDFNMLTLFSFIESGAVKIPGFQRNYVWDIGRASRLIESLLIGLPIPQIFLYEESRNSFLVIDGQQRLMSIYYFIKKRFPREAKRSELRQVFDREGKIPTSILENDDYFTRFNLKLASDASGHQNRLAGLNYDTLEDLKTPFDLRTVRNVIIKQNSPEDDDSSIYEIFNRLNSGGINLTPQEIRTSLYHSKFYDLLYRLNLDSRWRMLLGLRDSDLHMKDVEILLRSFALLIEEKKYKPSMKKFLNLFSKQAKSFSPEALTKFEAVFDSFLVACVALPDRAFFRRGKFNISNFDAVFTATCGPMLRGEADHVAPLTGERLELLEGDERFTEATHQGTASTVNVKTRLQRAREILL